MESGERLASPAPTLSASSLAPSPSALGSTLNTSGRLFGGAGDQPFIGSTLSSAFPLVNHPAFGALYTAGAGRPEFGGLGSIGMSAALAAHPQLGALTGKQKRWVRHERKDKHEETYFLKIPENLVRLHSIKPFEISGGFTK
uniref:Bromodomain adjacent to zinc finger domain 2B n=2 Tax=Poecilia TaxID=8080 RepID=A0A3B3UC87_9TELE